MSPMVTTFRVRCRTVRTGPDGSGTVGHCPTDSPGIANEFRVSAVRPGRRRTRLPSARSRRTMADMSEAFIVPPGEGRLLDLGNFEAVVLATAAQTDGELTLLQTQSEPPDFGPPLHLHRDAAEAFFVLEGEYLMFIEDQQTLCPPGTFVYVPRATPHTFKVVSAGAGKKLNLFSPAAMVQYFEELAEAEAAGTVTPELLDEIAARSNVEVLGPVPKTYL
ncbi:cupin domain-containing protein [Nocardioides antri]|uniref:Cupin domain-containing protein n=2 Tax=Nocardioides antri TaxID=2607659 RepID=A0A5B1M1U2_9ACTN|nr:cupin domain-containing protein [Nocardioides antri]